MNFSLTTFNKTGKLMQIEYALARVQQWKMALGIKGENNKVLSFGWMNFGTCQTNLELFFL